MSVLRVPRSGSMILTMLVALVAIGLLPIVFLAALVQSAEAHPRPLREQLHALTDPIRRAVDRASDHFR